MTQKIVELVVEVAGEESSAQDPKATAAGLPLLPEGAEAALVGALHTALARFCPGLSREALERMLPAPVVKEMLKTATELRSLESPKGTA
ncbi:MAG TPA: hypothetical protein VFA50_17285 [Stellaceae bacterium]|nr:hypothetical protein [Stellaceae bacterium]